MKESKPGVPIYVVASIPEEDRMKAQNLIKDYFLQTGSFNSSKFHWKLLKNDTILFYIMTMFSSHTVLKRSYLV